MVLQYAVQKAFIKARKFFLKQNPGEANLTIEQLREMLQSGTYSAVMSKLMHYAKNVTGTNAYWNKVKQDLKSTITQVGAPTIFWTLSCADFHWPELHTLFSPSLDTKDLCNNVINNPHILDWLFTERTEQFVKWWLYKSLGAKWHWFRYELALQQGSIHCHGLAELDSDPGLCELTKVALQGHLLSQSVEKLNVEDLTTDQLTQIKADIAKGKEGGKQVCKYMWTFL